MADAIQRLSPQIDTIVVSQGVRPAAPEAFDIGAKVVRDRARALDAFFYHATRCPLMMIEGQEILDSVNIVCSLNAISDDKDRPRAADDELRDEVSVYLFEQGTKDPARTLWNELRSLPETKLLRVGDTEVLRREVMRYKSKAKYSYWSPQPGVAVIVEGEKLLAEAVSRWSVKEPGEGPFPWSLPEWESVDPEAASWAIGMEPKRWREPGDISGLVLSINPKADPEAVRIVSHGSSDSSYESFPGSYAVAVPDDVSETQDAPPRVSVRVSLEFEEESKQANVADTIYLAIFYIAIPFHQFGFSGPHSP